MARRGLLFAAAFLLSITLPRAETAPVGVACEDLTKLEACVECIGSKCLACQKDRAATWSSDGSVTECRTTLSGPDAVNASGDPRCARSDGQWCMECNRGYFFNKDFKCVGSTAATAAARTLETCQKTSNNTACAACNPDGTCTRCTGTLILVPLNALYINANWRQSQCLTASQVNAQALAITWVNAFMPTNCIEVDTEFKCSRCKDGMSLVNGTCTDAVGCGGGYQQYCARCTPTKSACTQCNGSRSTSGGVCSLPCRQLYGIGCIKCTATACTQKDPAYSNGRR
ncbi:hypothetical protein ABPG77_002228 [Micractinium sp. CCAP 211/92]